MAPSNTTRAVDALLRKWEMEGVKIANPNSQERIEAFEHVHQVKLPTDFTQYLLTTNGMQSDATDKNGYRFWPLERVCAAADEFRNPQFHATEIEIANPELTKYLIFADYLQWSWAFAIRISGNNKAMSEVFRVDSPLVLPKLASSFAEFIDLYLTDSVRLYDPARTTNP